MIKNVLSRWPREFARPRWSHLADRFSRSPGRRKRRRTSRRARNPSAARPRRRGIVPTRIPITPPGTPARARARTRRRRAPTRPRAICQASRTSRIISDRARFTVSSTSCTQPRRTFTRRIAGSPWVIYRCRHWPEHRARRRFPPARRGARVPWRSPRAISPVAPTPRSRTVQV